LKRNAFITFEGIDGSGKTTQMELLKQKMLTYNIPNLFIRDPGTTAIGEKIRGLLLAPESGEMSLTAEVFLYAAARSQMVYEVINPALEQNIIVVCDRFIHSTLAYQGYGSGYDLETINFINREAMGSIWPDLTFIMDIEVEESFHRCLQKELNGNSKDRIEQRNFEFYNKVRKGYLALAKEDEKNVVVLPSGITVEEAHQKIWRKINERLDLGL